MKHILMIGTGGTIASQIGQDGLRPALTSEQLLCFVPKVSEFCRVDCIQHQHPAGELGRACKGHSGEL